MKKIFKICFALILPLITEGCSGLGYQPTYIISESSEEKPAQTQESEQQEKR